MWIGGVEQRQWVLVARVVAIKLKGEQARGRQARQFTAIFAHHHQTRHTTSPLGAGWAMGKHRRCKKQRRKTR